MINLLNDIRRPNKKTSFANAFVHTLLIFGVGIFWGVAAKFLDIYTTNIGNVFSQMSVWIFLCSMVAVWSSSSLRAAVNVFVFCIGMLPAYYLTAELTASVYSMTFVYGWLTFAVFSPVLGFCVWFAKGKGLIPKIIIAGVVIVMLAIAIILFDKVRISDIVFSVLTVVILLKK